MSFYQKMHGAYVKYGLLIYPNGTLLGWYWVNICLFLVHDKRITIIIINSSFLFFMYE